jgi:hypothetical protein
MRVIVTFDNGLAGQRVIKKLQAKFGEAYVSSEQAIWDNGSRELVERLAVEIFEDDIILSYTVEKGTVEGETVEL